MQEGCAVLMPLTNSEELKYAVIYSFPPQKFSLLLRQFKKKKKNSNEIIFREQN